MIKISEVAAGVVQQQISMIGQEIEKVRGQKGQIRAVIQVQRRGSADGQNKVNTLRTKSGRARG